MTSDITITGTVELSRNLERLGAAMSQALEAAALAGGMPIQNAAKAGAPKRTRTLARSIHMQTVIKTARSVWVAIGPREIYGRIHELGGIIRPRQARILAWVTSGPRPRDSAGWRSARREGRARFARQVTIRARPYMRPAFDANKERAVSEAREVLRQCIRRTLPR